MYNINARVHRFFGHIRNRGVGQYLKLTYRGGKIKFSGIDKYGLACVKYSTASDYIPRRSAIKLVEAARSMGLNARVGEALFINPLSGIEQTGFRLTTEKAADYLSQNPDDGQNSPKMLNLKIYTGDYADEKWVGVRARPFDEENSLIIYCRPRVIRNKTGKQLFHLAAELFKPREADNF